MAATLRWSTPLKGLLIGISRMNEDITGQGNRQKSRQFEPPGLF
jgi:hypothetical protein